ncbi:DNA topoisomerase I [Candidatus Pacearchaeota archaeon]|nr:DNA topoisomerase I [Candidatus Pacearchaeota archaeon]
MAYTLIITEKPQAAMKIAYCLSDSSPIKKNFFGVPYYEIENKGKKYVVGSAVGHLFGLAEKEKTNEFPVFDLTWKPKGGFSLKYLNALRNLARDADNFIVACDYDVEGEVIGFNVIRFICNRNDAYRMKFSALTKPDLMNSFDALLEHVDFGQAYAGETRHYLDWMYGINLSRALTNTTKAAGGFAILSIGRVQGPALAFIVGKEREIAAFKATPYWNVSIDCLKKEMNYEFNAEYPKDLTEEKEAQEFSKLEGKKGDAKTEKEQKEMNPWPPFDLTNLQTESYKLFKITPAQTLAIAQKLYLFGLISYPRTSSQKLPPTIGYKRILDKLKEKYAFAKMAVRDYPVQGGKTDPAHPAIYPTGESSKKLSPQEKNIYELIVKRFISCFCEAAIVDEKTIKVSSEGKEFIAKGKKIAKRSWLEIYPYTIQERELEDVNGQIIIQKVNIEEKETQPPRRYSPASIITELEKRHLGTKSTRASIIDTLYKRGYVTGTSIQATQLGMKVVETLEKNSPLILDEQLTRSFEEKMENLQEKKNREEMQKEEQNILEDAKKIITKIIDGFKTKEEAIGKSLINANNERKAEEKEKNTLVSCPICKKGMLIVLRSRRGKRFVACDAYPNCKTTFPLPQQGLLKVNDEKCPRCGFPYITLIKKGRPPWKFCFNPVCYQQTQKENAELKTHKLEEKEAKKKEKLMEKKTKAKEKAKAKAKIKREKEKIKKDKIKKKEAKKKELKPKIKKEKIAKVSEKIVNE